MRLRGKGRVSSLRLNRDKWDAREGWEGWSGVGWCGGVEGGGGEEGEGRLERDILP